MEIPITKIKVMLREYGTDKVWLYTTLPSGMPALDDGPLVIQFDTVKGGGIEYARTHFRNVPVISIDGDTGEKKTIREAAYETPIWQSWHLPGHAQPDALTTMIAGYEIELTRCDNSSDPSETTWYIQCPRLDIFTSCGNGLEEAKAKALWLCREQAEERIARLQAFTKALGES